MKSFSILTIFLGALALASCSGNNTSGGSSVVSESDISAFSGNNALAASATIDSLALEADFLNPRQAVSVLLGLNEIVKAEQAKGSSGKRLEYMRKYIDTYDILSDRGEEFTEAFDEVKLRHHIDFAAICKSYRDTLADEADGSAIEGDDGGVTEVKNEEAAPDSTSQSEAETAEPKAEEPAQEHSAEE